MTAAPRRAADCGLCNHCHTLATGTCAKGHKPRHYIWVSDPHKAGFRRRCGDFERTPIELMQIRTDLRLLAADMDDLAARMKHYGGFGPLAAKGQEMAGAANIARDWADNMLPQREA